MALAGRVAAVAPLVGALATAAALTGAAFFTVAHAGCQNVGHFQQRDGVTEFVGGCIDVTKLPAAPLKANNAKFELPRDQAKP
jgi:hypothetical protein